MVQQYSLNQILKLFDSTKDTDHDLRFMALNDLNKIITESPQQFPNYNRTTLIYANILIKSLDDQHSEVQNQAVKCFIPLAHLLKTEDILSFINQLMGSKGENSSLIISSVHTMATKTILDNLKITQSSEGHFLVDNLLPKLLDYETLLSKIDIIEVLNDTIQNLGAYFNADQVAKTYNLLIRVVFAAENTISKASIVGIGRLIKFVDERQISTMLALTNSEFFLNLKIFKDTDEESYHMHSLRLSILTVFFKEGSGNVIPILSSVLDIIFQNLFPEYFESSKEVDEEDFDRKFKIDQVRDETLLCLEAIIQSIEYESISPYVSQVLNATNKILQYDPFNNTGNDDNDDSIVTDNELENDDFEISDNDEFDYEPEEEEENDYDLSWSLRKNALKLIGKIVENYPLTLKQVYDLKIFDNLVIRLSDSSTNVSNEVIITLTKIILNTSKTGDYYTMTFYDLISNNIRKRRSSDGSKDDSDIQMSVEESNLEPYDSLSNYSELICDIVINKLFTDKNSTRFNSLFDLLSQLTNVLNGLPGDYLYLVAKKLGDLNLKVSIDLLKFYSDLFRSNDVSKFADQTGEILQIILNAANDSGNYELSLEGLNTASEFFEAIGDDTQQQNLQHDQIVQLGQILSRKASSKNYSNEIKQKCLHSLADLIKNYQLFNDEDLTSLLEVFEQSLEYESLIEVSTNEISKVVGLLSEKFDSLIMERILIKFVELLNLRSNELKMMILECLLNISQTNIEISPKTRNKVIEILTALIKQNSLYGKQISECLTIIGNLAKSQEDSFIQLDDFFSIIESVIPLIGNIDQDSILDFSYKVCLNLKQLDIFETVNQRFGQVKSKEFKMIFPGILASIALALNLKDVIKTSETYLEENIHNASSADLEFHVLFLGFIGRRAPLPFGLTPFLAILDAPEDTSLKTAVLSSIGIISTYDVKSYLPVILHHLAKNDLLSLSLRKILEVRIQKGAIVPIAHGIEIDQYQQIWDLLLNISAQKEDIKASNGELNVISECLTLIAVLDINKIDRLIESIDSTVALSLKYTIVSTVKYFLNFSTVLSQDSISFDRLMSKLLEKSSLLIFNENLQLKQTSVQALITSLHNKPLLSLPILVQLLSTIMEKELVVRKEYVETIQIGPFKHKIDNALNLRKSIYEMIYTLMSTVENSKIFKTNSIHQSLNYFDILKTSIERGLKDDNDVIQLSCLIIAKVVNLKPYLLFTDQDLLTAFKERSLKIINKKMKETDTKQVLEKQKESVKSIQNLISTIDNVFQKKDLQGGDFEDWRKFAFVNGAK